MKLFRKGLFSNGLNPVVTLAVGILMLVKPRSAFNVLMVIGGVLLLISGISTMLESISAGKGIRDGLLPGAVIRIALGVFMAVAPGTVTRLALVVVGLYLLLEGVIGLSSGKGFHWTTIVPLVLGALVLLNPMHTVFTVLQWAGIGMLAHGALGIAADNLPSRR